MPKVVRYKCEFCAGKGSGVTPSGIQAECRWCDGEGSWEAGPSVSFASSAEFLAWLESDD